MGKQICLFNSVLQDSKEYLYAADNLINHHNLYAWDLNQAYNADWQSKRPPLYPLILALFKLISLGSHTFFLLLTYASQNAASLFSFYVCIRILKHLNIGINWNYASLFAVLSLSQLIYSNTIMSESFLQLCLCLILYIQLCQPPTFKWSLFSALLIVCGLALKPVLMPLAYAYPVLMLLKNLPKLKLNIWIPTLLPVLFIAGISSWNYARTGTKQYSSISTINLLHYNTYTLLMFELGEQKADSIVDDIHFKGNLMGNYAAKQAYINKACQAIIFDHLTTYSFLHVRGMFFCLLDPGRFDISQFFGLPHKSNLLYESHKDHAIRRVFNTMLNPMGILLACLFLFNVLKLILMVKFLFNRSYSILIRIMILILPLYIVAVTGPIGASRFLMPVLPIIFIMSMAQKKWNLFSKN